MAELFNQLPYAVNVFPTGRESKAFAGVTLTGNAVLTNCHTNEKGEIIARIYNPSDIEEPFRLQVGDGVVTDVAHKGEVVSVVFKDGQGKVCHDTMPV